MGFLVGIIAFVAGLFIFASNLGSFFIGLPWAYKHNAKKAKFIYGVNSVLGLIGVAIVISLMCTVLSRYVIWILFGYFIIPLLIFIINFGGYCEEVKNTIANEKLEEMGMPVEDIGEAKKEMIDGILFSLELIGASELVIDNVKLSYEYHDKDLLTSDSITALKSMGFSDNDIKEIFKKWY